MYAVKVCMSTFFGFCLSITPLAKNSLFSINFDDPLQNAGTSVKYNPQKLFSELKLIANQLKGYQNSLDIFGTDLSATVDREFAVDDVTYSRQALNVDHFTGPWADYQIYLIKGAEASKVKYLCETEVKGILPSPNSVKQLEELVKLLKKYDVDEQIVDVSYRKSDYISASGASLNWEIDDTEIANAFKIDTPSNRNVHDKEVDKLGIWEAIFTLKTLIMTVNKLGVFKYKAPVVGFQPTSLCFRKFNLREFTPSLRAEEVENVEGLKAVLSEVVSTVSFLEPDDEADALSVSGGVELPIPKSLFNLFSCMKFSRLKDAVMGYNDCIDMIKTAMNDISTLAGLDDIRTPDIVLGDTLYKNAQITNGLFTATAYESTQFEGNLYLVGDLSRLPYILSSEDYCYGTPLRPSFVSGIYKMEHITILDTQCCYEVSKNLSLDSCPKLDKSLYELLVEFYNNDHYSFAILIGSSLATIIVYGLAFFGIAKCLYERCNVNIFGYLRFLRRRQYVPPMQNENNDVQMDLIPLPALRH